MLTLVCGTSTFDVFLEHVMQLHQLDTLTKNCYAILLRSFFTSSLQSVSSFRSFIGYGLALVLVPPSADYCVCKLFFYGITPNLWGCREKLQSNNY